MKITMAMELRFHIIDKTTSIPIEDVWVLHVNTGNIKFSDLNGQIVFGDLSTSTSRFNLAAPAMKQKQLALPWWKYQRDRNWPGCDHDYHRRNCCWRQCIAQKNVIGSLDLQLRPVQNSQEILRMVPGALYRSTRRRRKGRANFLRGFDMIMAFDVQITVDDIPVNMVSHAHGQGYADLHFVIPELVDKVDFNKGPYLAEKRQFYYSRIG